MRNIIKKGLILFLFSLLALIPASSQTTLDSIQKEEISLYEKKVESDDKKIQRLKSTQKKILIGSSVGGILLFILGLIL